MSIINKILGAVAVGCSVGALVCSILNVMELKEVVILCNISLIALSISCLNKSERSS